ncbi:MAG: multidrug MFS transporter [bacterium]|nr:MAG: multidrug MFS transporter [bacterium]
MLLTVNKSAFETRNLENCLKYATEDTPVLLYEDAVWAAASGTSIEPMMREALKKYQIFALQEDLKTRGLKNVIDGIKVVDYAGFVELAEKHVVCSWT